MKNFFRVMIACKDTIFENRDRPAADAFMKVRAFVEGASYSTCKRARTLAEMRIKGCDAHVISEHFGVSYDTIRTELKKMSKDLWGIFPEDFFEKLSSYKENKPYVDEVISALAFYGKTADDLLLMDVVRDARGGSTPDDGATYSIKDCRNEVEFLLRYSKSFYAKDVLSVDKRKLRYLIDVLDGKVNISEQVALANELGGFKNG